MTFTLTKEFLDSITTSGDNPLIALFAHVDPAVYWIIADPANDETTLTGTYVSSILPPEQSSIHLNYNIEPTNMDGEGIRSSQIEAGRKCAHDLQN